MQAEFGANPSAGGRKGWLNAAEFVATAPPQAKHKLGCSSQSRAPEVASADDSPDNGN